MIMGLALLLKPVVLRMLAFPTTSGGVHVPGGK
jgi:hypothetical protein